MIKSSRRTVRSESTDESRFEFEYGAYRTKSEFGHLRDVYNDMKKKCNISSTLNSLYTLHGPLFAGVLRNWVTSDPAL